MTPQTLFDNPKPAKKQPRWFPKNNTEMLERGYDCGSGTYARCRACGADIEWWRSPKGKNMPMNPMPTPTTPAVPHWATCPKAAMFRKATGDEK